MNIPAHRRDQPSGMAHRGAPRLADRGQWSRKYDCCQECGRTDRRHNGHGLCLNCYMNRRNRERTS